MVDYCLTILFNNYTFKIFDILNKLNRNVLNIKYDIKTLIEKNEKLEELILNTSNSGNFSNNITTQFSEDSFLTFLNFH